MDLFLASFLDDHHITPTLYEHPPVFTVAESAELTTHIPGMHTKNLFLTDNQGAFYLITIPSSIKFPINQFRRLVGTKDMTFGSADDMYRLLHLTPGSVSLCGLVYAAAEGFLQSGELTVYMHQDLWQADQVGRHPNRNDATLVFSHTQVVQFIEALGCRLHILSIDEHGVRIVERE